MFKFHKLILAITAILCSLSSFSFTSQDSTDVDLEPTNSVEITAEESRLMIDSMKNSLNYEYGSISISDNLALLEVPDNYKFLNATQSHHILTDVWGNPPEETLGLLFLNNENPYEYESFSYAVEITYSEEGFIEDDDAKDLDYDELLEEMQDDTEEASKERVKLGYESIELVGWASPPFYDETNKKLHWAKEIKFGESSEIPNTLNYNIRVLGRKGYINLNVIGDMDQLPKVKTDIHKILASIEFTDGNRYSDFNPEMDEIAAYGIGGLIAGKVLAKAGFFAILLKFWKIIAVGAVAAFAGVRKFFGGNGN